ncbi:MAG TPA: DNA recombination protein RmuC, partial [bacterium]|nr:DNA recombination protein RmuC [bacterium]
RLGTFIGHLQGIGKGLDTAQDHYRRAVGSFDSRVLVSARRFETLGIKPRKPLTWAIEGEPWPEDAEAVPLALPAPMEGLTLPPAAPN